MSQKKVMLQDNLASYTIMVGVRFNCVGQIHALKYENNNESKKEKREKEIRVVQL